MNAPVVQPERWYVIGKDDIAAQCHNQADAEQMARILESEIPKWAPYIVTRLAAGPGLSRSALQVVVHKWCVDAFGDDHARSVEQRGIRLVEEAIEAAQACGCAAEMIHRLVDHIFAKPVGDLRQELGGVGVTVLACAQAAGINADEAERDEVARVLSKPLAHFAARNAAKNAAGFDVTKQGAGCDG